MKKVLNSIVVGLTGGIASGKTTVLKEFEKMGAEIIDADLIGHAALKKGGIGWKKTVEVFGDKILGPRKSIDRSKLADIVFNNNSSRKRLEGILHPLIISEMNKRAAKISKSKPGSLIVLDIPLLFEKKLNRLVNKTIVVWTPRKLQIERLKKRDCLTDNEITSRLDAQWPLDRKKQLADFVVNNELPLSDVRRQIKNIWKVLTKSQ